MDREGWEIGTIEERERERERGIEQTDGESTEKEREMQREGWKNDEDGRLGL